MTIDPNSRHHNSSNIPLSSPDGEKSTSDDRLSQESLETQQTLAALRALQTQPHQAHSGSREQSDLWTANPRVSLITLVAIALVFTGLVVNNFLLGLLGTALALLLSLIVILPWLQIVVTKYISPQERSLFVAFWGMVAALVGLFNFTAINRHVLAWSSQIKWEALGTVAEWFGALGQILIAVIAVYVAWRQYIISKDLTIQQNLLTAQQNLITQQQTIDTYFQGISDLVLDDEGLLEDWPQERAIAEGRTAAILSSVDGSGKAKILRFLSRSNLLTPLKRDMRLGRAILSGRGSYAEDRIYGVRVIDLGVMLAGADLSRTDLRWTDLSEVNLIHVNLSHCDLVKANLSRAVLYDAQLVGADFKGTRLFYSSAETATPRSRKDFPNYKTGERTGAVVEDADFTDIQQMSESVRYYCCAWGGEKTRATIPGGCEGIPNKLGR